jgi:hypothetical protein
LIPFISRVDFHFTGAVQGTEEIKEDREDGMASNIGTLLTVLETQIQSSLPAVISSIIC